MFKNMLARIRQVMYKMGLIKGIQKLSDNRDIPVNDEMYDRIEIWQAIYAGYLKDWHDTSYMTINGKKQRKRASMRMAKVASQKMATLIFNEKCEINISEESLEKTIKDILKENKFNREFRRYLEYGFALGGMVMKAYYEDDKLKISYTTADCFIPLAWDNFRITEGVFVSTFRKGNNRYTHLEWHLWEDGEYVIRNELYEAKTDNELGVKVPLSTQFKDLEEEIIFHTIKKTIFVYFKPNIANNFDTNSPLGISIFANALDTLKTLDIAFDSFQREFALGKKRIIVPASAIKTVVDPITGQLSRYFDADDEVYESMSLGDGLDAEKVHDISIELRVEEHVAAINANLNILAMQIGFNAGTFTFDGLGVKTATEVVSENSETFRTKQDHETNVEAAIQELVDAIVEIADAFNVFPRPADYEVTVAFDDSIAQDKDADINEQIKLLSNGLQLKKKALMKIHGLTEKEAEVMLKEIQAEQATATAQAIDFFGVKKNNQNQGKPPNQASKALVKQQNQGAK
ncbi:phage portal protein [Cytobacillus oceanisediminis]|uniref:phage portal protein n=1 Tax=Cytobacillus oceanisediminis TaxID=665099 RepID=UPI001C220A3B|nr:phage portal protein [Cytobacillus oceanisediminis]MBU8773196.1 phage portal protein [Cytobacillus oceanisediminis]